MVLLLSYLVLRMMQFQSKVEARKPGLHHHMSLDARNPYFCCLRTKKVQVRLRIHAVFQISALLFTSLKDKYITRLDLSLFSIFCGQQSLSFNIICAPDFVACEHQRHR